MLSIVVPIKNHGSYLKRLLSYYCNEGLKERVFVADSSDAEHVEGVRQAVDLASRNLSIEYRSFKTDIAVDEKLSQMLGLVRTEYCVLGADDDFFALRGLRRAVDFLQVNSDFSVAHGHALLFEVEPGPIYGRRMQTAYYVQRSIEHPTGAERLLDHFRAYSTNWYSVHHTKRLLENMHRVAERRMDTAFFTELLPSALTVVQGKTRRLDVLYMVRQAHRSKRERRPTIFDWVSDPSWSPQYKRFEDCLARELAAQDNISRDRAAEVVKEAFWLYLAQSLTRKWQNHYAPTSTTPRLKRYWGRRIQSLPALWQLGRSFLPGEESRWLLPALLRSGSPYHADFMPIYRVIEGQNA